MELWKSDGTDAGTVMLIDILPGPGNGSPESLSEVDDLLFFSGIDPDYMRELFVFTP
ncbi:MAG: hypothetical protein GY854_20795 [Deltaproteobacteria bacterium]|nr:hypothetical protein [Deltaproteobacteria bacterium]